jgi:pimeloyl-ACP methyl ester carboxylesterase
MFFRWTEEFAGIQVLKCPTLITHGTHDKAVPFSHGEYVHENISHSELYAIEKGYHSGILYVGEHKDQI